MRSRDEMPPSPPSVAVDVSATRARRSLRGALALTLSSVLPLGALVVWAVNGPHAAGSGSVEAARDGVREIPIREYTWGFGPRVVSVSPGERVRFVVRSEDIAHGFAINELGINLQLLAGTEVRSPVMTVDLPEGRYPVHCSVFCGMGHPSMKATLVVGTPRRAASQGLPWAASLASLAAVVGFAVFAKGGGGPSP